MIRHLFKLIWNRKKSNFLLISEIFFSFLVLFGVLTFGLYNYHNYQKPLGFNHENVWQLWINPTTDSTAQNLLIQDQLLQRVRSFPEVAHASLSSSNTPFSFNTINDDLSYGNNKEVETHIFDVQDEFKDILSLQLSQGRWFGPQDNSSLHQPIVINQKLKDGLFGTEDPLGKLVSVNDTTHFKVIGVVNHFRPASEYSAEEGAYFGRINLSKDNKYVWTSLIIKVKQGTGVSFEEKMVKEISAIAKGWSIEVTMLDKMRQSKAKMTLVPLLALAVVCGFLVFNVALGLFGVLWYNINKRTSEIGLRRAMGATTRQIRSQFVGEVLVIATFGLLLGLLLAVQFPLLKVFQLNATVYWQGMGVAAFLIFLLVTICAIYPSHQASKIYPAAALHEE